MIRKVTKKKRNRKINKVDTDPGVLPRIAATDIAEFTRAGFKTIVCNRPAGEGNDQPLFHEIQEIAKKAGLECHYLAVESGKVTDEDAEGDLGGDHLGGGAVVGRYWRSASDVGILQDGLCRHGRDHCNGTRHGVEIGIVTGVGLSLVLFLGRIARPHFAVVGQVPGTYHFRNVKRHDVVTSGKVLSDRLDDAGVTFHLSEVKGPVMDKLEKMDFLTHLTGNEKGPAETGPFSSTFFCRRELSGHQPVLRSQISILIRAKIRGRAPVLPARKSATALSSFLASA